jgi:epoxide hydrolase
MSGLTRRGLLGAGVAAPLGVLGMPALAEESTDLSLPQATDAITPFRLRVPEAALIDLKRRLAQTRWPERETVPDVTQGAQLGKVRDLAPTTGSRGTTGAAWKPD